MDYETISWLGSKEGTERPGWRLGLARRNHLGEGKVDIEMSFGGLARM